MPDFTKCAVELDLTELIDLQNYIFVHINIVLFSLQQLTNLLAKIDKVTNNSLKVIKISGKVFETREGRGLLAV